MSASKDSNDRVFCVVVMTPAPGKMDELEKLAIEGAKYNEQLPECLSFHATKTIDQSSYEKGWTDTAVEGELVLVHEWVTLEALQEAGRTEFSVKKRGELEPLMAGPPIMKISKPFAGSRK
ncbi:MAG: hypothetical protein Q9227_008248 [Pyrenula ochraceoflavens]